MKVKDITKVLETLAPLDYAESFDNVGLLVGDANAEVTGVLITLDTLEAVVEEAIEKIKTNSRRYAKRQYTFFNNQFDTKWIKKDDKTLEKILDLINL